MKTFNRGLRSAALAIATVFLLSSCAVTQSRFYQNPTTVSDAALCRAYLNETGYSQYVSDLIDEVYRRGLSNAQCQEKVNEEANNIGGAIVAAALIGLVVAAAAQSGGGYPYSSSGSDWDQFYNQYGQLTFRCREIDTGQFTEHYNCASKIKDDDRWPGK